MRELLGPIIGITLVLACVFLPAAFIPGITGQMYRQFALVIAATAILSGHQRRDAEADPVGAISAPGRTGPEARLVRARGSTPASPASRGLYLRAIAALLRHARVSAALALALMAGPAGSFCASRPIFCRSRIRAT